MVPAEQAVPYPRTGHQSRSAGHRELLEQPAARLAAGRVGVTPVPAIASRAALVDQLAEVTDRFADHEQVPVPPNWGGYRIAPDEIEFWQGREDRLHNRIRVVGGRVERLQP